MHMFGNIFHNRNIRRGAKDSPFFVFCYLAQGTFRCSAIERSPSFMFSGPTLWIWGPFRGLFLFVKLHINFAHVYRRDNHTLAHAKRALCLIALVTNTLATTPWLFAGAVFPSRAAFGCKKWAAHDWVTRTAHPPHTMSLPADSFLDDLDLGLGSTDGELTQLLALWLYNRHRL